MKKIIVLALCILMAVPMTACASKGTVEKVNTDDYIIGENVQIPNPFVDCETMEEAGKLAGFDMTVPESIEGYGERLIQAVEKEIIQVFYFKGEGENKDEILIRKFSDVNAASGDYNVYSKEETIKVDDVTVTVKGNNKVNLATWQKDGYAFCIMISEGTDNSSISELISKIK